MIWYDIISRIVSIGIVWIFRNPDIVKWNSQNTPNLYHSETGRRSQLARRLMVSPPTSVSFLYRLVYTRVLLSWSNFYGQHNANVLVTRHDVWVANAVKLAFSCTLKRYLCDTICISLFIRFIRPSGPNLRVNKSMRWVNPWFGKSPVCSRRFL